MLSISGSSFILHFFQIYRLIQFLVDIHYTVIVIPCRDNLDIKHWSSNSQVLTLDIEMKRSRLTISTRYDLSCNICFKFLWFCVLQISLIYSNFLNRVQVLMYIYKFRPLLLVKGSSYYRFLWYTELSKYLQTPVYKSSVISFIICFNVHWIQDLFQTALNNNVFKFLFLSAFLVKVYCITIFIWYTQ